MFFSELLTPFGRAIWTVDTAGIVAAPATVGVWHILHERFLTDGAHYLLPEELPNIGGIPFVFYCVVRYAPKPWDYSSGCSLCLLFEVSIERPRVRSLRTIVSMLIPVQWKNTIFSKDSIRLRELVATTNVDDEQPGL